MRSLEDTLQSNKQIRVIGFDDAPFTHTKQNNDPVYIAGIICSNTRFEGMLWGKVSKDGNDATDALINLVQPSKFYPQIHAVLLDGIAFGGFNIIDLPRLSISLQRPCITVMRQQPDLQSIYAALNKLPNSKERLTLLGKAGQVYHYKHFYYQVFGCHDKAAAILLDRVTDIGHIPEALRLAHLIGSAVIKGASGKRA